MELKVTHMMTDNMGLLSASCAELGDNAGQITWQNSLSYGREFPLLTTDEEVSAARDYFREFGAWSDEEIDAWTVDEVNAITCQEVAQSIREWEGYDSYSDYEKAQRDGQAQSNLYHQGDDWFFTLSH